MSSDAAAYCPNGLADASDVGEVADERHHSYQSVTGNFPIPEPSDEQLLSQVGFGSRDALGLLFRRHARAVFHLAWRILRHESEAADLRQAVFLYLSDRSRQFDCHK